MKVRFYEPTKDGESTQEVGVIELRNGKLVAEPDRLLLTNLLREPLVVYMKDKSVKIDPESDPKAFLEALPKAIRGSYFWAGEVEE